MSDIATVTTSQHLRFLADLATDARPISQLTDLARAAIRKAADEIEAKDAEITKLKSQLEEARADDYIDKLNVLCEDFGCEGGSDRLAWLHDELSKISRLQSRIEELASLLREAQVYCPHDPVSNALGNRIEALLRSASNG